MLLHPGLTNFLDFDRLPVERWHAGRLTIADADGKRAWTNPVWSTEPA